MFSKEDQMQTFDLLNIESWRNWGSSAGFSDTAYVFHSKDRSVSQLDQR